MCEITAVGTRNGEDEKLNITLYDDGEAELRFDGETSVDKERDFGYELEEGHAVGGTFFPEKGSPLWYLAAINYYFYPLKKLVIKGDEVEQMESEKGVVY